MQNPFLLLSSLIIVAWQIQVSEADGPVPGPPTWIVDAQVKADGPDGASRLIGTVFDWHDSRQNWATQGTIRHSGRTVHASRSRSRSVLILQSERFIASMSTLRFTRLDGSKIESKDIPAMLKNGRGVAFLPKGTGIHPAIVSALHPETVVATRVSYPSDPVVIPILEE